MKKRQRKKNLKKLRQKWKELENDSTIFNLRIKRRLRDWTYIEEAGIVNKLEKK